MFVLLRKGMWKKLCQDNFLKAITTSLLIVRVSFAHFWHEFLSYYSVIITKYLQSSTCMKLTQSFISSTLWSIDHTYAYNEEVEVFRKYLNSWSENTKSIQLTSSVVFFETSLQHNNIMTISYFWTVALSLNKVF